jgi:HSP20 family protein
MRRDDRDDPFDEFFEEIERLMNEMMHDADVHIERGPDGSPNRPTDAETADVHFDVYEEADRLRVVADVPGIEKSDIDLKCDGEVLTLDAAGAQREYHERVSLPRRVDEHSANATFNNGILEVTFAVDDESADIDLA